MGGAVLIMIMRPVDETASCDGVDSQTSLSVPAKFAPDHGDFLLAVLGSCDLGIYHVVFGQMPFDEK